MSALEGMSEAELEAAQILATLHDENEKLAAAVAMLRELRDGADFSNLSPRQLKAVIDAAKEAERVAYGVKFDAMRSLGGILNAAKAKA